MVRLDQFLMVLLIHQSQGLYLVHARHACAAFDVAEIGPADVQGFVVFLLCNPIRPAVHFSLVEPTLLPQPAHPMPLLSPVCLSRRCDLFPGCQRHSSAPTTVAKSSPTRAVL